MSFRKSLQRLSLLVFIIPTFAVAESPQAEMQQQKDHEIAVPDETVIVTATRANNALKPGFGALTMISAEDIQNSFATTLVDILAATPGLNISQAGGLGAQTSLFMRGSESNHSLILINGQQQKISLGSISLQYIDLQQIERIEILRGNQSSLYGSDAIGGVINIITKQSARASSFAISAGSNKTQEITAGSGNENFSINVSTLQSEGINSLVADTQNDADEFERASLAVAYQHNFHKQVRTQVNISAQQGRAEYDQAPYFDFISNALIASTLPYTEFESSNVILDNTFLINDFWQSSLTIGQSVTRTQEKDLLLPPTNAFSKFTHQIATLKTQAHISSALFINLGIDIADDQWEQQNNFNQSIQNDAAFALLQYQVAEHLLSTSIRHDDNEFYGEHQTHQVTWEWSKYQYLTPYLSTGTGFKAPDFDELYSPYYVANPDLAPETSQSIELGLKSESNLGEIDFSLFKNNIENFIIFEFLDPVLFTGHLVNVEEVEIKGAEISHHIIFKSISINSNATYIDARNVSNNTQLLRRPERLANINISYDFGKIKTSLGAHGESARKDIDNVTFLPKSLPGFVLVHAQAAYQLNSETSLQLRVNNILDKEYQVVDGYNSDRANFMLSIKTVF